MGSLSVQGFLFVCLFVFFLELGVGERGGKIVVFSFHLSFGVNDDQKTYSQFQLRFWSPAR